MGVDGLTPNEAAKIARRRMMHNRSRSRLPAKRSSADKSAKKKREPPRNPHGPSPDDHGLAFKPGAGGFCPYSTDRHPRGVRVPGTRFKPKVSPSPSPSTSTSASCCGSRSRSCSASLKLPSNGGQHTKPLHPQTLHSKQHRRSLARVSVPQTPGNQFSPYCLSFPPSDGTRPMGAPLLSPTAHWSAVRQLVVSGMRRGVSRNGEPTPPAQCPAWYEEVGDQLEHPKRFPFLGPCSPVPSSCPVWSPAISWPTRTPSTPPTFSRDFRTTLLCISGWLCVALGVRCNLPEAAPCTI